MRKLIFTLVLVSASSVVDAQNLTPAQKDADFRYLASLYSTYYAPIDWKKQLFNFDALNIGPWLDQVAKTTTDLDFYELEVAYVASLNDTHDHFTLTSDFSASLGFTTDVYDGVLLIDSLNRTQLPVATYPFVVGDQLMSVDGVDVQKLLQDYAKYGSAGFANPISNKRSAATRITSRPQSIMPHATDVLTSKTASVVIKRQNGNTETYTIPWVTTGTPLEVGPVPSPKSVARAQALTASDSDEPDYMTELRNAQWSGILNPDQEGVLNYGSRNPIFVGVLTPAATNFTQRLGKVSADFYYSGTFKYDELTIGYIRIPSYGPASSAVALTQFEQEIAYMSANTDGLIVDEMRNPGGLLCFGEEIAARLIPYQFRATGFQLRPYFSRIISFYNSMINAINQGAPQQIIDQYRSLYLAMLTANQQGKTITDSLPLCTSSLTRDPLLDGKGNLLAYQKPVMMLIDGYSTSTADSVPGMFQDAKRGPLFGLRTMGAGGNNTTFDAGSYAEGTAGMTLALQTRKNPVGVEGYPHTILIENVGVQPDIPADYMTKDNLLQSGAPFVSSFLQHMAAEIRAKK
ncbi:MAG TPA: S41 family peptidase [Bryobacteraceae bacterium]|jgi:hypothetical protein|nr:S41 family peptidase [Bryobacteraceae bacterium]